MATAKTPKIATPLLEMIDESPLDAELLQITKLKRSAEGIFAEYVDLWILTASQAGSAGATKLAELAAAKGFECCLDSDEAREGFDGIVRALTYKQTD